MLCHPVRLHQQGKGAYLSAQIEPIELSNGLVTTPNRAEAFAYCERLARAHYENFPVGSLLVPKARRKHVYSIYAFARIADDFADEDYDNASLTEAERLKALDDWEAQLSESYLGRARHPVFVALAETVTLPETVDPDAGAVIETAGGWLSGAGVVAVAAALWADSLPAASMALTL